ncbi:MAG: glutamate--tRNA ligase [Hyphomicrobiaceae bacterium]
MSATAPIVRFAPSPTGLLHIGNLRTALVNWLYARKTGGRFLLRFDDTDRERSKPEFESAIREDLSWLGLEWAAELKQSERTARYDAAAEKLRQAGRLYACTESEVELESLRRRQLARGRPPVYDRSVAKPVVEGQPVYWRCDLGRTDPAKAVAHWEDGVRGPQEIPLSAVSDPVVQRADGSYLYTFTSVVDDADCGVTQIIRGEDHVTNTAVQIALFDALGAPRPAFAHHSLLIGADGEALSKRLGALSLRSFREAGLEPMAVASHAALIGTSDPIAPHASLEELAALFDLGKLSRAPARFDPAELAALNAKLLHGLGYDTVRDRLAALGVGGGAAFWEAVRGNLSRLADARDWWEIATGTPQPVIEDGALCDTAARLLPSEPWDQTTWGAWTAAVKAETGASGRKLFHPLRLALTGREAGPELRLFLPFIGRERALKRLAGT